MKKVFLLTLVLLMFCFTHFAMAQNGPLVSKMDVMKVVVDVVTGEELLEPVEGDVFPGDILLYVLTYENTGDEVLQNLRPVGPVPEDTEYIQDSAKSSVDAGLEFSIDGGENFSAASSNVCKRRP